MLLAADVGGTKTFVGLFDRTLGRPRPRFVRQFATADYAGLVQVLSAFAAEAVPNGLEVEAACFGLAGRVTGDTAELTNVAWRVDARRLADACGTSRLALLNDLEALAWAVPVLDASEMHVLQAGVERGGNMALIAAGTGLGEALLLDVEGRFVPSATEAGHADFAARNEREMALLRDLIQRFGRAEAERVISGRGLVNIHRVTHRGPCLAVDDEADPEAPAKISHAALERRCGGCIEALDLFVDAYGAEAGNLALRTMATGGVFIGGGIAPKILPALDSGRFLRAFADKAPFDGLLADIPVRVILNPQAALTGAAVFAATLLEI